MCRWPRNPSNGVLIIGRSAEKLRKVAQEIKEDGGLVRFESCDVRDEDIVGDVLSRLAGSQPIDGLVNCAGGQFPALLSEMSATGFEAVVKNNLVSTFIVSKACYTQCMRDTGGAIVNIASISGQRASTLRVAYGTSKAGLMHLTKQMAVEFAGQGIRVNCVAPGPVVTELMQKVVHNKEKSEELMRRLPIGYIAGQGPGGFFRGW